MHERAYPNEASEQVRYKALVAPQSPVAYSRPLNHLTPVEMRALGRTRKAAVHGKMVAFMRLSPTCKVTPVWNTCWHEEYESEAEAFQAALTWEQRIKILTPGFQRGAHEQA